MRSKRRDEESDTDVNGQMNVLVNFQGEIARCRVLRLRCRQALLGRVYDAG